MITVVNYGLGNINAIVNAYKRVGVKIKIAAIANDLKDASKIILPGVGHFDHAMNRLNDSGMRDLLDELVLKNNIPVLGICVGMQIMTKASEEGKVKGLGWINAEVRKFDISKITHQTKIPHMGWNGLNCIKNNNMFDHVQNDAMFYFLHSYYVECLSFEDVAATTEYAGTFTSVINYKNIYGVQFHPEKSHHNGEILLHNFAKLYMPCLEQE